MPEEQEHDSSLGPTPLKEFIQFFGDFNSVYALIAKFAMAAPLLDLLTNIGPPWPSRIAVGFLVVIVQMLIVMCSFAIWRQGRTPLRTVKMWLVTATAAFISCLVVLYLPAYAVFVHPNPTYRKSIVGGLSYTKDAGILAEKGYEPSQLLKEFNEDPTLVWTNFSLVVGRLATLVSWLFAAICYGIGVSAFVAIQYRRL